MLAAIGVDAKAQRQAKAAEQVAAQTAQTLQQQDYAAKILGFSSVQEVQEERKISMLVNEIGGIDALQKLVQEKRKPPTTLPDQRSPNPERRAQQTRIQAANAPYKTQEVRPRTVTKDKEPAKNDAKTYLIEQYTESGELFCQMCRKEQPVKVNGNYFFDAFPFISNTGKLHDSNYLCLCPNHSRMFKEARVDDGLLSKLVFALTPDTPQKARKISLNLGGNNVEVYFTANHLADLQIVLQHEGGPGQR